MGKMLGLLAIAIYLCQATTTVEAQSSALTFGSAAFALNGPWRFRIGDDPRWADPNFGDASWETVDLTPLPGAHDGDQGLTNYTEGWSARGHHGYAGFTQSAGRTRRLVPIRRRFVAQRMRQRGLRRHAAHLPASKALPATL
jgi:hypothetical protein